MTDDDFIIHKPVLTFIREYLEKYKQAPTPEVISTVAPDWAPLNGDFQYWVEGMRNYTLVRKAQNAIQRALQGFQTGDLQLTLDRLVEELSGAKVAGSTHIQAMDSTIGLRLDRYRERKEKFQAAGGEHLFGMPTTFEEINKSFLGWMPGELVGIFSRPGIGKTWKLVDEVAHAWVAGYRVLCVAPEMPLAEFGVRIDTVASYKLGLMFSAKMAHTGHPSLEDSYARLAEEMSKHERLWVIDSVDGGNPGLSHIKNWTAQFHPDIIFVDGIMLLANESRARESFAQMHHNAYGLKTLGTSKSIPIITTHQSVNFAKGNKGNDGNAGGGAMDWRMPTLDDAADGEAYARACSTVITMAADKNRDGLRWYALRKSRERQLKFSPRGAILWNVDRGRMVDLSHLGQDEQMISMEMKRLGA